MPTLKTPIPLQLSKTNQAALADEKDIWLGLKKRIAMK